MPTYNHYASVANLLSKPEWLQAVEWEVVYYGTSEIRLEYEPGVVIRLKSTAGNLQLNGLGEPTQGTITSIEIGTADGSATYETIEGLSLSLTSFFANIPDASGFVLNGTVDHEIYESNLDLYDFYGGSDSWDANGRDGIRFNLLLDQFQTVYGGSLYGDTVSYRFDENGEVNQTAVFIDLENTGNGGTINTFEAAYESRVLFATSGAPIASLFGINNAQGGGGNDIIIGRPWWGNTSWSPVPNSYIQGRSGSTVHGFGGDDILSNALSAFGGDGHDLILLADYGEFVTWDEGVIENFADGGTGNDTFLLTTSESVGAATLLMNITGGSGIDTIAFSDPRGPGYGLEHTFQVIVAMNPDGSGTVTYQNANTSDYFTADFTSIENVTTSNGADQIDGSNENNVLNGMGSIDIIQGFGGNDTIIGGAGGDFLSGGSGIDTLSYETSASGVSVNLHALTFSGGDAAGDQLLASDFENLTGSEHDDTLTGTNGDNVITGLGGNNTLNGLGGNDTIFGGNLDDTIDGGDGNDIINTGNAYFGTALFTTPVVTGTEGNTSPGTAYDINPWFVQDVGAGDEVPEAIVNVTSGPGNGFQYFVFTADETTTQILFQLQNISGGNLIFRITLPSGAVFSTGLPVAQINTPEAGDYVIEVIDSFAADPVPVNASYDLHVVAEGFQPTLIHGSDIAHGGIGNDTITAGDGDDQLFGDAGDDWLQGAGGADTLNGGADSDWFVFDGAVSNAGDVIEDRQAADV
ncbi:MAG: calcium-binding protein, partial [Saprospiraceae bacterium]